MAFREGLFGFADFGALQVPDFERDLFKSGRDQGQGGDVVGVSISRDDLGSDGGRAQSQPLAL